MKRLICFLILVILVLLPIAAFPAASFMPGFPQFFDNQGNPCSGCLVYTYENSTSTPKSTYTDSSQSVLQSNPIILNSRGEPSSDIWMNGTYTVVLKTAAGSTIRTRNGITGLADASATAVLSQWSASGLTPTYISATTFSTVGDNTAMLEAGRRIQVVVSAGTKYGKIISSVYSSVTTTTIVMDSGSLDSGLSSMNVGLLTVANYSIPTTGMATFPAGMLIPYAGITVPAYTKLCDGSAISRTTYSILFSALTSTKTATITIATPAVVSATAHGFSIGDKLSFETTGALPTGLVVGTNYYVSTTSFTVDDFRVSTTIANALAGTNVATSGSQSGTQTVRKNPYGAGDGTTTFNVPDSRRTTMIGAGGSQVSTVGPYTTLGAVGGEETHVQTVAEIATHDHSHSHTVSTGDNGVGTGYALAASNTLQTFNTGGNATTAGSSTAANVMQPSLVVQYLISTGGQ